ncbi:MAG: terminase small subunit [bacterium]
MERKKPGPMSRLPSDHGAIQEPPRPTRPRGHDHVTERQHRFLLEVLADPTRNAAQAHMRAGYRVRNARVASAAASRMLTRVSVRREYRRLLDELNAPLRAQAEALVAHCFSTACADITDVILWDSAGRVTVRPLEHTDAGVRAAVSRMIIGPQGQVRVEMGSRDSAARALIAFLGLCERRSWRAA